MEAHDVTNFDRAPARYREALRGYVVERTPLGGFLRSVLEGDLFEAVGRSSQTDLAALPSLCRFVRRDLPLGSFGTKERVAKYLGATGALADEAAIFHCSVCGKQVLVREITCGTCVDNEPGGTNAG